MMHLVVEGNPIQNWPLMDGQLVVGLSGQNGSPDNPTGAIIQDNKGGNSNFNNLFGSGSGSVYNNLLDNTMKVEYDLSYLVQGLSFRGTLNYQDDYKKA